MGEFEEVESSDMSGMVSISHLIAVENFIALTTSLHGRD